MRVDDDIRLYAAFTERHIDRWPFLRTDTLLAVPGGELVTNDRASRDAKGDAELLAFGGSIVTSYECNDYKRESAK